MGKHEQWLVNQVTNSGAQEVKLVLVNFWSLHFTSPAELSIIPLAHLICRSDLWHISGSWVVLLPNFIAFYSNSFMTIMPLLKAWENTLLCSQAMLAQEEILPCYLRPFLPKRATGNSYPHHTRLDKGALDVLLPPWALLELGFRCPTVLIRVSIVLHFPGTWPQTSAKAQSPFSGNHTNIQPFCNCPSPFQSSKLEYYLQRQETVALTDFAACNSEAQKLSSDFFVLCSAIINRPTLMEQVPLALAL